MSGRIGDHFAGTGVDGFPAFLVLSLLFLDGLNISLGWPCLFLRRTYMTGEFADHGIQFRPGVRAAGR
jgi:hypothetical protein